MRRIASLIALLAAGFGGAVAARQDAPVPPEVHGPTLVEDRAALARLRRNSGLTLQWISWDYRGRVRVTVSEGRVHLSGSQAERGGPGRLELEGDVVAIGTNGFTFDGRIAITDTPDRGRNCLRDGTFEFRITQNRRYWRLREMTMCDGLTDYVDIYF